jgi:hypothetical protein
MVFREKVEPLSTLTKNIIIVIVIIVVIIIRVNI